MTEKVAQLRTFQGDKVALETSVELSKKLRAVIDEYAGTRKVSVALILGVLETLKFDILSDAVE